MKEQGKTLRRLFFSAMLFCMTIWISSTFAGSREVYAATQRVQFTDGSGSYVKVITSTAGNRYYLYDKNKKPLTGIQYIRVPLIEKEISSGFYMFDEKGKLIRQRSVYKIVKTKVHGVLFHGYYYTNKNGKFLSSEYGLFYLNNLTCSGARFHGYFYLQKYGKLNHAAGCRYLNSTKINGVTIEEGYYWFSASGKLITGPAFQTIKETIHSVKFDGTYCFGGKNGKLILNEAGLHEINGKTYYLNQWGRRTENAWVGGHYFLADGTMAVNMKVPDGSFVDEQGNKVDEEEYKEMQKLKSSVENYLKGYAGTWSVYVKNLDTNASFVINDCSMYAASTIKPFVMASTFNQIRLGKLSYDSTIRELMWYMITESDNLMTNALIRYNSPNRNFLDGAYAINDYINANGYHTAQVHHMLQTEGVFITDGGSNRMCATDAGLLLEKIYKGTCVNAEYSKEMLRLLLNQKRRWKIPAGVPSGIKVANKTGETDSTQHDMAIVYGPKTTYILCVFSTDSTEYYGIRNVSKMVYEALNK